MSQLDRHVATVRSREAMTQSLKALATTLAVAAGVTIVAILLEKFLLWRPDRPSYRWLAGKPLVALAGVAGIATLVGVVLGIRRRPSEELAAVRIDETLGTKEKFSTALYLQRDPKLVATDPFVRATVMDAIATADRVDLSGRFPIQFPRTFVVAITLACVAFGLSYLKKFDLFGREESARLAQVESAKQAEAKKQIDGVLAQISVAAPEVQSQEDVKLAKQKLQELASGAIKDAEAGQRTAAKAQQSLNDAKASREKIKNAQAFAKAKNNQKMLASLDDPKDQSPVSEVQRDIKKGDMDAAMDKMSDLAKKFERMDAKEKEKAADQMDAMAQQLKDAMARSPELKQLAQQMQQQGANPQQAQQLQQLMQQAAQGNQQAAQQAQQQVQQMMQQANATPQQQQAVQQLAQQMQGVQNSQALMQQMQQAAQQMAGAMQQQAQQAQQQQAAQQGQQGQQQQAAQGQQAQQQQAGQQQGQQAGQQQGQQAGQQQGQQQGQQPGQGQQAGQQQGQQQGGQQAGQKQGGQQQGQQQQGGQQAGQQGMNQGAQQMQDAMQAIKQDMQQMQAAQKAGQQGGQQGQQQGGQQGGQQQGQQGGQQGQQGNGGKGGQGQQGANGKQGGGKQGSGKGEWKQGQPQGQANAGPGGLGQGAGERQSEEAPFDFKEEISKSQENEKGQILAQTLVKSDSEKGESTAELREVVRSNLQESTDEVDNQRISRQAQKAVKDYFSGITGQAQPDAPATDEQPKP